MHLWHPAAGGPSRRSARFDLDRGRRQRGAVGDAQPEGVGAGRGAPARRRGRARGGSEHERCDQHGSDKRVAWGSTSTSPGQSAMRGDGGRVQRGSLCALSPRPGGRRHVRARSPRGVGDAFGVPDSLPIAPLSVAFSAWLFALMLSSGVFLRPATASGRVPAVVPTCERIDCACTVLPAAPLWVAADTTSRPPCCRHRPSPERRAPSVVPRAALVLRCPLTMFTCDDPGMMGRVPRQPRLLERALAPLATPAHLVRLFTS